MKYKMSKPLCFLDGKEVIENGKPRTMGQTIVEALIVNNEKTNQLDPQAKFKYYQLAVKISDKEFADLTVEETALAKDVVGRVAPPLALGQIWEFLEKPEEEKKEETNGK